MIDDDTVTCVSVKGFRVICRATCATKLWCGYLLLEGSALDRDRCTIAAGLVRMVTGSKCYGTTFRSLGNILQMYLANEGVIKSISTAEF